MNNIQRLERALTTAVNDFMADEYGDKVGVTKIVIHKQINQSDDEISFKIEHQEDE